MASRGVRPPFDHRNAMTTARVAGRGLFDDGADSIANGDQREIARRAGDDRYLDRALTMLKGVEDKVLDRGDQPQVRSTRIVVLRVPRFAVDGCVDLIERIGDRRDLARRVWVEREELERPTRLVERAVNSAHSLALSQDHYPSQRR